MVDWVMTYVPRSIGSNSADTLATQGYHPRLVSGWTNGMWAFQPCRFAVYSPMYMPY